MITVNAIGDTCPIPVVKTKQAIASLTQADVPAVVETLVDNEIAVENLEKMARQSGYAVAHSVREDGNFSVQISIHAIAEPDGSDQAQTSVACQPVTEKHTVVVIRKAQMGDGDPELGKVLLKGFIYALSQQDELPETMLFYNGGAAITCEGSESLEDLKELEAQGVQILTCGTCLNFYGLTEKLRVGEVTNMYEIARIMTGASLIVNP